jgi:hypothetical protein
VGNLQYVLPFLLVFIILEGEGKHSSDEESVYCEFVLRWVVGEKVYGGVSGCRLVIYVYVQAGGFSNN